jgi:hypothetical protein
MQFQPAYTVGVLELEDMIDYVDEIVLPIKGVTLDVKARSVQPGGRATWNSHLVTEPTV